MVHLLALASAHERRFGALVVDVGPEIDERGLGRRLGLLYGLVDDRLALLVDFLGARGRRRLAGEAYADGENAP